MHRLTLQILLIEPVTGISGIKRSELYKRNDIVWVCKRNKAGRPNPRGKLGFIHIDKIPDRLTFNKIRTRLTAPLVNNGIIDRKREWIIPIAVLPLNARNELLANKEITTIWDVVKPYIRRKIVFKRQDFSQDSEITELSDADVT